jgi:hypothetical protein
MNASNLQTNIELFVGYDMRNFVGNWKFAFTTVCRPIGSNFHKQRHQGTILDVKDFLKGNIIGF